MYHGKGKLVSDNTNEYQGMFSNGKKNGNGTQKYFNGDVYRGEWLDDQRHGLGTFFDAKNEQERTGNWVHDQEEGQPKKTEISPWKNMRKVKGYKMAMKSNLKARVAAFQKGEQFDQADFAVKHAAAIKGYAKMPKEEHKGEKHHEKVVKSRKSEAQISFTFENKTDEPVTVKWHDYDGVKKTWYVLGAGDSTEETSGVNSAWSVESKRGTKLTVKGRSVWIAKEDDHEKNIRIEVKKDIKKPWEVKKDEKGLYKVAKDVVVSLEGLPEESDGKYRMAKHLVINHHFVWFRKDQQRFAYYMGEPGTSPSGGHWAIGTAEMLEEMIQNFKADPKPNRRTTFYTSGLLLLGCLSMPLFAMLP